MRVSGRLWLDNPVAVRELRMRMRGGRAYLVIFGYVLVLSLALFLGYLTIYGLQVPGEGRMPSNLGQLLFQTLYTFQILLLAMVIPGLTAWLLSIEHEQQTIELLSATLLKPAEIVAGKLIPALLFLGLLLLSSVPLSALCLLFGGLTPYNVAAGYVGLLAYGGVLAGVGVLSSSLFKKSFAATIIAYIFAAGYSLGLLAAWALVEEATLTAGVAPSANWAGWGVFPGFLLGYLDYEDQFGNLFGIQTPIAALVAIISGLLALLLATAATANIPHSSEDRAPKVRTVFVLLTLCAALVALGSDDGTPGVTNSKISWWFALLACGSVLIAPQFSAVGVQGHVQSLMRALAAALWTPRRWLRTDACGGFWFALFWAALMSGVICLSIVLRKASAGEARQGLVLAGVSLSMTASSAAFGVMVYALVRQVPMARALAFLAVSLLWTLTSALYPALGGRFGPGSTAQDVSAWIACIWPVAPFLEWSRHLGAVQLGGYAGSASAISILVNVGAASAFLLVANRAFGRRSATASTRPGAALPSPLQQIPSPDGPPPPRAVVE